MTNERVIELLHRLQDEQFDGVHGDERREALEMAVRALESNLVKESGDLVKDLVEDSSSDLISRQETIEYCVGNKTWHDEDRATGDTIYRQDAIDIVRHRCKRITTACVLAVTEIEKLPPAQQERKTGRWMDNDKINFPQCSECGMWIDVMQQSGEMNYCPNCGARME